MLARISKLTIALVLGLLTLSQMVAANPYRHESRFSEGSDVKFNWEAYLRVGSLVGEPLVDARLRWSLDDSSTVEIPDFRISGAELRRMFGREYRPVRLHRFPDSVRQSIALVSAVASFRFSDRGEVYFIVADMGALGKPDGETWSFNVTGSPDWDDVIFRGNASGPFIEGGGKERAKPTSPLSASDAKAIFKRILRSELKFDGAQLISYEVSTYDLQNWYVQNTPAVETLAMAEATTDILNALYQATGFELDARSTLGSGLAAEMGLNESGPGDILGPEQDANQIVEQFFAKWANLPKDLYGAGDAELFEAAVMRATRQVESARSWQTTWRSKEPNPKDHRTGSPKELPHNLKVPESHFYVWNRDVIMDRRTESYVLNMERYIAVYHGLIGGAVLLASEYNEDTNMCSLQLVVPDTKEVHSFIEFRRGGSLSSCHAFTKESKGPKRSFFSGDHNKEGSPKFLGLTITIKTNVEVLKQVDCNKSGLHRVSYTTFSADQFGAWERVSVVSKDENVPRRNCITLRLHTSD